MAPQRSPMHGAHSIEVSEAQPASLTLAKNRQPRKRAEFLDSRRSIWRGAATKLRTVPCRDKPSPKSAPCPSRRCEKHGATLNADRGTSSRVSIDGCER